MELKSPKASDAKVREERILEFFQMNHPNEYVWVVLILDVTGPKW